MKIAGRVDHGMRRHSLRSGFIALGARRVTNVQTFRLGMK